MPRGQDCEMTATQLEKAVRSNLEILRMACHALHNDATLCRIYGNEMQAGTDKLAGDIEALVSLYEQSEMRGL